MAESTPINEAAVLYSQTQAGSEKSQGWDAPQWGAAYGALGGLMMAGVQSNLIYEEDVAAGWLLADGKPRYPMLFLVGLKATLPAPVDAAIEKYRAARGRVFTDADCGEYAGATRLDFGAFIPAGEGFSNDACFLTLGPKFETLGRKLKETVAQYRNFPLDTDDAWISRGLFDAGSVRYVMLAAETRSLPWYGGLSHSFGLNYTRTVEPRTVSLSYPTTSGVVYDVFDHRLVKPEKVGNRDQLAVDLRQFSGRLYALAPAPLAAPAVTATVHGDRLALRVQAMSDSGRSLAAQIPLRIRLFNGAKQAVEEYRCTAPTGGFEDNVALPLGDWTIEVTELLGGHATSGELKVTAPLPALAAARPDVETFRPEQLEALRAKAKTDGATLVLPNKDLLTANQVAALKDALAAHGVTLATDKPLPAEPKAGILLTVGYASPTSGLGPLLETVRNMGLVPELISPNVPGPGRGFIAPVYSVRGYGENVIVLVGGDPAGLGKTVAAFCERLDGVGAASQSAPSSTQAADIAITCRPAAAPPLPRLSDMVGPKLNAIATSRNSPYLAVSAAGFGKNLAVVQDQGSSGMVVIAQRVGASPRCDSLFVSPDGRFAGLSARELDRCGQAFHLRDAKSPAQTVFAAFGDMATRYNHFAASSDGQYVVAGGTYGVVCWRREGSGWKEAWADDYWKSFDKLTWPISDMDERIPTFHAYIPEGADYVLVVFSETANNGWVTPDHHSKASLAAYRLADGHERWRFEIPIPDAQLFPFVFFSPDGRNLLVKVQNGSWNAETYSFFSLDPSTGVVKSSTPARKDSPGALAIGNGEGLVAATYAGRNLELRTSEGTLLFSQLWSGADPVSLSFSADGKQLYVADDAGRLTCVARDGELIWRTQLGAVSQLAISGARIYAAGWDGRVRAISSDGRLVWTLDCTAALDAVDPLGELVAACKYEPGTVVAPRRSSSASPQIPPGEDLVAGGMVNVSGAKIEPDLINALQSGKPPREPKPMISAQQLMQDMLAGQQAQVIFEFPKPTDLGTITVYEDTRRPESYPTDSFIGVWDEASKQWTTARRGVFLDGPVNSYAINAKGVTKLIYCPWNNYGHNFYTQKIELRALGAKNGYEQNFDGLALGAIEGQDLWNGKDTDAVVADPAGGKMLKLVQSAQRPLVFARNSACVKQTLSLDFLLTRTINDGAYAPKPKEIKQCYFSINILGPDPNQELRFEYEGARNEQSAWLNGLRSKGGYGPHTIAPKTWYHAEVVLDRAAGTFQLNVTDKATGKLYWRPDPVPCGKLDPERRGPNLLQLSNNMGLGEQGAVLIDNLTVTAPDATAETENKTP